MTLRLYSLVVAALLILPLALAAPGGAPLDEVWADQDRQDAWIAQVNQTAYDDRADLWSDSARQDGELADAASDRADLWSDSARQDGELADAAADRQALWDADAAQAAAIDDAASALWNDSDYQLSLIQELQSTSVAISGELANTTDYGENITSLWDALQGLSDLFAQRTSLVDGWFSQLWNDSARQDALINQTVGEVSLLTGRVSATETEVDNQSLALANCEERLAGLEGRLYSLETTVLCNPGELICDGACAAIQTDANNCGACGVVCGSGEACWDGVCVIDSADVDRDNDGWTIAQGDCDDNNPERFPGNIEFAGDGVDSNCDGFDS